MVLLVLLGTWVTRLALRRELPPNRARVLVIVAGFAALLGAARITYGARFPLEYVRGLLAWGPFISPEFLSLLASGYLWWLGIVIGRSPLPHEQLEWSFFGGLLALAALLLTNSLRALVTPSEALWATQAFFATGLGALALAAIERRRRSQPAVIGSRTAFNRYWLGTVAGVVGAVLLGGLLVAALLAPQALEFFSPRAGPVFEVFLYGLILVLAFVTYLFVLVFAPVMEWLMQRVEFPDFWRREQRLPEDIQITTDLLADSPLVRMLGQGLFLLLIAAGLALAFWLALRRFKWLNAEEVEEMRESIVSRALLLDQLRKLFARRPAPPPPLPPYLPLAGPPDDPRLIVRRAYQGMLEWAQAFGLPRAAGQTPGRYAEMLARVKPEGSQAVAALTRAYVHARYAAEAPSLDEARQAKGALAALYATANRRDGQR
jgi:hypothetical protein